MKRFVTALLTLCLLVSLGASLTSCKTLTSKIPAVNDLPMFHECDFVNDWTSDENYHWHSCTGKFCKEVSGKEEHMWDKGVITTESTPDKEGVVTFTCTVCEYEKHQKVKATGLSKESWEKAFETSVFENFTYTETSTTIGGRFPINAEMLYQISNGQAYVETIVGNDYQRNYISDKDEAINLRDQLLYSIRAMTNYEDYIYDAESDTYKATTEIGITALNTTTSDVSLKFADGKLVEIKYSVDYTKDGTTFHSTSTVSISLYGLTFFGPFIDR